MVYPCCRRIPTAQETNFQKRAEDDDLDQRSLSQVLKRHCAAAFLTHLNQMAELPFSM